MTKLKMLLGSLAVLAFGVYAFAQTTGVGFWPNWPLVGGASYGCGTVNGVQTCTVPAGPTILTGNETIPANSGSSNTSLSGNVLIGLGSLNAFPLTVQNITAGPAVAGATPISASNISGGILYNSTATITSANITLPLAPINGQQFTIASNRTITTLLVAAGAGSTLAVSTPTVLTASTTVPQGYKFVYNTATLSWFRLQ